MAKGFVLKIGGYLRDVLCSMPIKQRGATVRRIIMSGVKEQLSPDSSFPLITSLSGDSKDRPVKIKFSPEHQKIIERELLELYGCTSCADRNSILLAILSRTITPTKGIEHQDRTEQTLHQGNIREDLSTPPLKMQRQRKTLLSVGGEFGFGEEY